MKITTTTSSKCRKKQWRSFVQMYCLSNQSANLISAAMSVALSLGMNCEKKSCVAYQSANSKNSFQRRWLNWRRPRWRLQTFAWMFRSVSACVSIRLIFWHCVMYVDIRTFPCSNLRRVLFLSRLVKLFNLAHGNGWFGLLRFIEYA